MFLEHVEVAYLFRGIIKGHSNIQGIIEYPAKHGNLVRYYDFFITLEH